MVRAALRKLAHAFAGSIALVVVAIVLAGCPIEKSEALDPSSLPDNVRADYEVFAQRCSKCHSLQRPLASGITDDDQWSRYVARMRRQPGSGISKADEAPILRFLHYYAQREVERKTPKTDKVEKVEKVEQVEKADAGTPADGGAP
jgi:hypothetical protein